MKEVKKKYFNLKLFQTLFVAFILKSFATYFHKRREEDIATRRDTDNNTNRNPSESVANGALLMVDLVGTLDC